MFCLFNLFSVKILLSLLFLSCKSASQKNIKTSFILKRGDETWCVEFYHKQNSLTKQILEKQPKKLPIRENKNDLGFELCNEGRNKKYVKNAIPMIANDKLKL